MRQRRPGACADVSGMSREGTLPGRALPGRLSALSEQRDPDGIGKLRATRVDQRSQFRAEQRLEPWGIRLADEYQVGSAAGLAFLHRRRRRRNRKYSRVNTTGGMKQIARSALIRCLCEASKL
jgi:hypothetical protein